MGTAKVISVYVGVKEEGKQNHIANIILFPASIELINVTILL